MNSTARAKTLLFFASFVVSGSSADAVEICLKGQADVHGNIVRLGDVAQIKSVDGEFRSKLASVELFPAPRVGRSRLLRRQEVRELLRLHGWDTADWNFSGVRLGRVSREPPAALEPGEATGAGPADAPQVLVATRRLMRGETIRSSDLQPVFLPSVAAGLLPARQASEAVGFQLTKTVEAGQPVDIRYLKQPILIERGQLVTVYAKAAGVVARMTARSLGSGGWGELIQLESPENRQRFTARVTGSQQAEVYASGTTVSPALTAPRLAQPPGILERKYPQ
jgi:flagella basal body P-ring formation protein FlgA